MEIFLQRFAAVVWGVLSGFDRVVFKGRLPQLYSPDGMNCYAAANHVRRLDFKAHAKEVTRQVLASSLVESAKAAGRFQPIEVQIGLNGREWLAHRMDREGLKYRRSDNKFLWVEDWQQAQRWLAEQQRTNWVQEFDALWKPLHPGHLGRLPLPYNWAVHQSEWATDVAFRSRAEVAAPWCERAAEPGGSGRKLRALNPLATGDAALLTAVSDPRWQLNGLRNGDLSDAVFGEPPVDPKDRKRRGSQVSRL